MIRTILVATRDRDRLGEIMGVVSRFRLGVLLARLGIERASDADGTPAVTPDLPRRTRLALEELGPTFVKLGQILATRGDLLSPEWIAELEQLHSRAPTLPFEGLRIPVESALGQPVERPPCSSIRNRSPRRPWRRSIAPHCVTERRSFSRSGARVILAPRPLSHRARRCGVGPRSRPAN